MRKARLVNEAKDGQPDTFITLTLPPIEGQSFAKRAQALAKSWRLIRQRACRKYGYKSIPFFAVFEEHKSGMPHLHILARCKWIDFIDLQAWNKKYTGGAHVRIERVKSRNGVAMYVGKYMSKDPMKFTGCKRYWRSIGWFVKIWKKEKPPLPSGWWQERDTYSVAKWHRVYSQLGCYTEMQEDGSLYVQFAWGQAP